MLPRGISETLQQPAQLGDGWDYIPYGIYDLGPCCRFGISLNVTIALA